MACSLFKRLTAVQTRVQKYLLYWWDMGGQHLIAGVVMKFPVFVLINISSFNRLIVVHAGFKNGFLENAALIFKVGKATWDYHGQWNGVSFEKWVEEKLVPSLSENSVFVIDNGHYHKENKPPSKHSQKVNGWFASN